MANTVMVMDMEMDMDIMNKNEKNRPLDSIQDLQFFGEFGGVNPFCNRLFYIYLFSW